MITYFELSADFLRLKSDGRLLADFEVPGAENFYCQIPSRLEDTEASPEGRGHAAGEQRSHKIHITEGTKKKMIHLLSNLYTRMMQIMKKVMVVVKK